MKKSGLMWGILLLVGSALGADLLTAYKKGVIKIVPDASFGAGTTWDLMFEGSDKQIAFLPDGSFFKACYKDSNIYRFDSRGNQVADWGKRKGQGPGDLTGPLFYCILDDNTLVVYEEGNRRLSLFDLEGRFLKIVKLDNPAVSTGYITALVALDNNRIALAALGQGSTVWIKQYRVIIKNLESCEEKEIASFSDEKPQSPIFIRNDAFDGLVYLARGAGNTFIVAFSKSSEVSFYSYEGEKVASFNLSLERVPITFEHLEFVAKPDPKDKDEMAGYQKVIVGNKEKIRLPEFHPFYLGFGVDPEGRVILVLNNEAKLTKEVSWQIYAPEGKLLSTLKIDPGEYQLVQPHTVHLHGDFLYAMLAKADADGTQFLARIPISN